MKRCPECDSLFSDTDQFCELDGTQLVSDSSVKNPSSTRPPEDPDPHPGPGGVLGASRYQHSSEAHLPQNWKILAIVAVAGVAIGIVLFIVYLRVTREAPGPSAIESSNEAVSQPQFPVLPSRPPPFASASPSAEPSPSPSARQSPTAQADPTRASLSSSPISTGNEKNKRGPVTIRLTSGTSVDADEVWETEEGIWYRRRGLVTLLQRNEVKAIDNAPMATPSPAATPGASPSTSP
ncbi:hypothetical protein BH18ACI4_BH18ACI4_21190 [soil metagenome]